ncbi:MAG: tetratricopeptide repeat protein [Deltaproteobacteria bacterium]|nr:tetratricopeptide repeat protein [Deltaproteobacteria bacterium]
MFDFRAGKIKSPNKNYPTQGVQPLQKRRNKKPRSPRPAFIVVLLAIILLAFGWWLWQGLYPPVPRFNSMLISMDGELQNILPGETISLHSSDSVKIHKISTNILQNINVRLASEGFDVNALRHEQIKLSSLLPDQNIFDHYKFRVWVKYRNENLGYVDWEIQPYAEDWLEKANRTVDDDKRLEVLEHGLRSLPEDSNLWRRLLDEYKSQKRWKQAASMLEKMADKDPNEEILNELLEVYAGMSSKTKIISVLKKLIKLDPGDLSSRLQLAEILEKSGKSKSAIKEYEELVKRVGKQDRLPIYKSLGYLYSKTGSYEKAISYYLKAAKSDKKDANLYYNLSYLYEKTKQKEKADTYLGKAVRLNKKDVGGRLQLAEKLIKKGELKKAEKYVSEILKNEPSSLNALILKAMIAEKRGEKKELEKIYEKIYSLDKKNDTVVYNLGVIKYEKGDLKSALTYFSEYIKKNPEDAAAREIIYDIYIRQNNEKMAYKEAQVLVKLKPKRTDLYNFMFDYLNAQGDYKKIIHIMEKGLKANPEQTDLRRHLLFAYLKTGKDDLAVKQIKELLKTKPRDIDLLLQMARLLEKGGNFTEALETYKAIITISPDHEEAEEAYLRLRLKGVRNK